MHNGCTGGPGVGAHGRAAARPPQSGHGSAMATVAGLYGFGDDSRSHGVRFMERQRTVQRDDTYDTLIRSVDALIVFVDCRVLLCPR